MRVRSDIWVAALVRRAFAGGASAAVLRRGAEEAGAIFVAVDRLDGGCDLWGPAPQAIFGDDASGDRAFERLLARAAPAELSARRASEMRFDPDFWWVEIEDRAGRHFIEPPPPDPDAPVRSLPDWPPKL